MFVCSMIEVFFWEASSQVACHIRLPHHLRLVRCMLCTVVLEELESSWVAVRQAGVQGFLPNIAYCTTSPRALAVKTVQVGLRGCQKHHPKQDLQSVG